MSTLDYMTTSQVAQVLGVSRQAVLQRVEAGSLKPAHKLPGQTGTYLFDPADVCPTEPRGTAA
ncbi:helix-turn-helix domain-containing protein [Curtobacterium sp. VKM Ac-1376]|uniref:helix-turn-helix domain-containing protein n=1 Tax=Curtobacterium sp. VKM Ac-1376 TaxID=123312 RepID=UPI00188DC62A|nr:helix-turn-helix domain-containing protein [Curtobacterium sp. VKM Ac-1376]MBF4613259.1 helix-turn-helix domain-containing protein [Curtobacterium sp. VKM Ac-1376]